MIAYALRSLSGAWDVMNGRPAGLEKLDLTLEGFWRSFAVIVPAIPLDAIVLAGDRAVTLAEGRSVQPLGMEEYAGPPSGLAFCLGGHGVRVRAAGACA
jgi:hypothetical protein